MSNSIWMIATRHPADHGLEGYDNERDNLDHGVPIINYGWFGKRAQTQPTIAELTVQLQSTAKPRAQAKFDKIAALRNRQLAEFQAIVAAGITDPTIDNPTWISDYTVEQLLTEDLDVPFAVRVHEATDVHAEPTNCDRWVLGRNHTSNPGVITVEPVFGWHDCRECALDTADHADRITRVDYDQHLASIAGRRDSQERVNRDWQAITDAGLTPTFPKRTMLQGQETRGYEAWRIGAVNRLGDNRIVPVIIKPGN